jgi:hypothetical protein
VIVMTARWAAALGILSRARSIACASGAETLRSVHVGNRLYRSLFGREHSGPADRGSGQGSLGEELAENGEEVLVQCLANVSRQEWMVAKTVAPPGGGHLLGTADDIPGAPPGRPLAHQGPHETPPPVKQPRRAGAPYPPSSTASDPELRPRVIPDRSTLSRRALTREHQSPSGLRC